MAWRLTAPIYSEVGVFPPDRFRIQPSERGVYTPKYKRKRRPPHGRCATKNSGNDNIPQNGGLRTFRIFHAEC